MTFVHQRSNPTFPVASSVATFVVLTVFLVPSDAYAQSVQVLDTLIDNFQTQSKQWEGAIKKAAISLFWILAAIELSVSSIFMALQGAGAQTFAAELVKRILVVGIFYFILDSGSSICNAIVESLKQLAFNAGGVKSAPSAIFNSGWNICQKILNEVSLWKDAGKAIVLCLAAFIIIVCFALIAAMMIVTLVEVAIVSYAGIILLGFGGSSFTKDYAVKYLTYAVSVGIKIMMMTLVVSVGQSIMIAQAQNFKGGDVNEIIVVIGVAVVFLAVTKALPSMLQSLVMGSSVGSNTTLPAAASAVAGASAAALGAMAGGGAVLAAAAKGSGGSLPVMAGRAIGAVAGSAFNRLAGMPGSQMGSIMGNAASSLRHQNQQRQLQQHNQQRSLTPPGSAGGASFSGTGSQQGYVAGGGRPTSPSGSGGSGPTSPAGSSTGGGPHPTPPKGAGSGGGGGAPAPTGGQSNPARLGAQPAPAASPGAPVASPSFQAGSTGEDSGDASALFLGSFVAPRPLDGASALSEPPSAPAADTTSPNAAAGAPASAGSEAVPATSGAPSSANALGGRSAETAQTVNQPARAAISTTERRANEPVVHSEAARSSTYVHGVPLTRWRVPPSKPTKPTTPR